MEILGGSKIFIIGLGIILTAVARLLLTTVMPYADKMKMKSSSIELINKVLSNNDWKKIGNRIVAEEAFEQLYSKSLSYDEICILLYCNNPHSAFKTYLKYRRFYVLNDTKTKIKFRGSLGSLFKAEIGNIKVPVVMFVGSLLYIILTTGALYGAVWIIEQPAGDIFGRAILWALDITLAGMGILFLLGGAKYHFCEKDALKHIGSEFKATE